MFKWLTYISLLLCAASGEAETVTVQSTDSVYNYDSSLTAGYKSTTPQSVAVTSGTSFFTFSATGQVSLTPLPEPYGPHGPDGGPPDFNMNVYAANGLSGVKSTNVGYLAGVFLNGAEPTALPPATLNYSSAGIGETFSTLSPLIDQVFYIGDGLAGTGMGSVQQFFVPAGAMKLALGIVDANGYAGPPGAYFDNNGSYQVSLATFPAASSPSGVPELGTWAMMIFGMCGIGFAFRSKKAPRDNRLVCRSKAAMKR